MLLDVSAFGLTGRQAESALLDAGVVTNRNSVPRDPNGAWYTSGIRIGTPALTTRGFGAAEFDRVAELMIDVLKNTTPGTTVGRGAVEGDVRAGRRGRRPDAGRVGGDARRQPPLPRPRALTAARARLCRPTDAQSDMPDGRPRCGIKFATPARLLPVATPCLAPPVVAMLTRTDRLAYPDLGPGRVSRMAFLASLTLTSHYTRCDPILWDSRLISASKTRDTSPMTSAQRYIVHLVARRHVDFGMTRSMMCMSA